MKTIYSYINVNYAEWQYFLTLPDTEKLQYLFDVYDVSLQRGAGVIQLDLSKFFESVADTLRKETDRETESETVSKLDFDNKDIDRVDVMIDDESIMIESNSLKSLRFVSSKFVESGYILSRDKNMEKMFRKDKVTKYLRIFKIVDQISGLCTN
jgi:hypothetical protein